MADTPITSSQDNEVLSKSLGTDLGKLPGFLKTQQEVGNKAVKAKVEYEAAKSAAELGAKREAVEKIGAEDKAHYEEVKKEMKPTPEFKPTQDNAMDLGAIFSMIATMGVALGGSGKLSGLNAMNAMGGMLKGYQQGRKDLFSKEQATFDKEMASMKAANDALLKDLEQYQKLRVTDKEAALLKAGEIVAKNGPIIKQAIETGQAENALEISKSLSKLHSEIIIKSIKTGVASSGKGLTDFFPGIRFDGSKTQNQDKFTAIGTAANSLIEAQDLKEYAKQHPDQLGRQGQVQQNFERYYQSLKGGSSIDDLDDQGQPALIFAKRYAAYLVGYERTLAGSSKNTTVSFQNRFNNLMSQDQFNAKGFEQLMNEQMNEVSRATAKLDPSITGKSLLDYGKNIRDRSVLNFEQSQQQPTQEKDEKGIYHWEYSPDKTQRRKVYE